MFTAKVGEKNRCCEVVVLTSRCVEVVVFWRVEESKSGVKKRVAEIRRVSFKLYQTCDMQQNRKRLLIGWPDISARKCGRVAARLSTWGRGLHLRLVIYWRFKIQWRYRRNWIIRPRLLKLSERSNSFSEIYMRWLSFCIFSSLCDWTGYTKLLSYSGSYRALNSPEDLRY